MTAVDPQEAFAAFDQFETTGHFWKAAVEKARALIAEHAGAEAEQPSYELIYAVASTILGAFIFEWRETHPKEAA